MNRLNRLQNAANKLYHGTFPAVLRWIAGGRTYSSLSDAEKDEYLNNRFNGTDREVVEQIELMVNGDLSGMEVLEERPTPVPIADTIKWLEEVALYGGQQGAQ